MNSVNQGIRKFILENFFFDQDGVLGDEDSFMECGIIDSTGILELVSFIEEKFSMELDSDDLVPENLDSVARLTRFISARINPPMAAQNQAISAVQGLL